MSGLFDSLSAASRSLLAARFGMDVAGQNIANINTVGYTRRMAMFSEVPPSDVLSSGGGVSVIGAFAMRDRFVDARLRRELMDGAFDTATAAGLTEVEGSVGLPGQSLDGNLTAFFDAFSTLTQDPTSISARDAVVRQGQQLAQAFRSMTDRFSATQRNADGAINASIEEVNELAAEVARLNDQISAAGPDVESLRDQRDVAISRLSELAGVAVTARQDGGVDLTIGNGRALVMGVTAYSVTATTSGPSGFTSLSLGGFDITPEVTGGTIGGLIKLRDTTVPGYQNRLDQLAYDLSTRVNTLHQGGFDAAGAAGGDFFVPLAGVAGAAGSLSMDAALAANSQLVAASGTGGPGDNQVAQALAALRDARIINGGTATAAEAWGQLAYRVGTDVRTARSSADAHGDVMRQLQSLRAQTSGVSMDEEAANLMRFQRSYEANARYFSTIVDTLDTLLNMV